MTYVTRGAQIRSLFVGATREHPRLEARGTPPPLARGRSLRLYETPVVCIQVVFRCDISILEELTAHARCYCMTAGWGETEVPMDVSSRRLAHVLHRHLAEHGLLSFLSLLRAFRLNAIKRNQAERC